MSNPRMNKFPLPLHHGGANHRLIILDEAQDAWLRKYYPIIENNRIAKAMGTSAELVRKLARKMGLSKSEEGLKAIKKRRDMRMAKTNERNGCYDRKRGHPCSAATMAGNARRWQDEHNGVRENAMLRIKREEPERYAAWLEKRSAERKESIRKEKMRMVYGLERKTKLKTVVLKPYTESQRHYRHSALKRGYLLDVDCSEGTVGRYTLYYDDKTHRSAKFEANAIADGFKIVYDNTSEIEG